MPYLVLSLQAIVVFIFNLPLFLRLKYFTINKQPSREQMFRISFGCNEGIAYIIVRGVRNSLKTADLQ